jgi:hypothetical protein
LGVPGRRPGIAEPERRQDLDRRRFRPAVGDRNLDEDVFGRRLRIFDEHVEVAIVVEDAGVDQLVLEVFSTERLVATDDLIVRVCRLRVLVQVLHVRVGRRGIEIEVVFLHVLAVVCLAVGEAEQTFLEDRILPVPQRQREAEELLIVGDAGEAVLAPAIRARAGLVVAEVVPGVSVLAVVFAHGPPLPLAQVGAPLLPRDLLLPIFVES